MFNGEIIPVEPFISVVITTVDRKSVIQAIDTALAQINVTVEVIVVVDGGDQNTVSLIKNTFGAKVKVLISSEKKGANWARNTGIRESTAPWIALLDDDDLWDQEKLYLQYQHLTKFDTEHTITFCNVSYWGHDVKPIIYPLKPYINTIPISSYLFCTKYGGFIQTSTLFASSIVMRHLRFDENLPRHQDWDWVLRASAAGYDFTQVDASLVFYHVDITRPRQVGWDYSYNWARSRKTLFSKQAYYSFILIEVLSTLFKSQTSLLDKLRNGILIIRIEKVPIAMYRYLFYKVVYKLWRKLFPPKMFDGNPT